MSICFNCKKYIVRDSIGTCYAVDNNSHKICYDCCAEVDKQIMRKQGKIFLYFVKTKKESPIPNGSPFWVPEITNWPGTLRIPVLNVRTGRHNIARKRYDIYFMFEGKKWHGYGDNTQVYITRQRHSISMIKRGACHCKVLKD